MYTYIYHIRHLVLDKMINTMRLKKKGNDPLERGNTFCYLSTGPIEYRIPYSRDTEPTTSIYYLNVYFSVCIFLTRIELLSG